jgi:hypothetical protein
MCWDAVLIRRYHQKYHKDLLLKNRGIMWTIEMLEELTDWLNTSNINHYNGWGELSCVDSSWKTPEILQRFSKKFMLGYICANTNLDWPLILKTPLTAELFKFWTLPNTIFIGIVGLISNPAFPWTMDLIREHIVERSLQKQFFNELTRNPGFRKTRGFIDTYANQLDFSYFSHQENVEWSEELIETYDSHWNWSFLSRNKAVPWNTNMLEHSGLNWELIANNETVFKNVLKPQMNYLFLHNLFITS